MSEPQEPTTTAGDKLLTDLIQDHSGIAYHVIETVRAAIPRIEAEARRPALDVDALAEAIHRMRWCKDDGIFHRLAHDDTDEDGYRAALAAEYAAILAERRP